MKKIISAVLALTVLLSLCACNGDVAENETSDVSSVPVISIDPSSMLSSDSPSSDIPSNEGSKPDENASSEEPTPPPTPDEEEEQARIQKALNNPGASLDYDVFLVDAPEEGNEWKLLRYNMEEEELYDEFSFSPKNATGSYTVEFADEYVGNILKVSFEDGMNCYIDVEKNKFYNSSEFKGLSKTLSVTKRNIGVTKNGQYEVWTTSHPDYGKVYYSELNEDDNLLLTVFLKNNKYTFTSYDYETKEFKNLFTISEKPEVKLLNDGWFIFELEPPTETEDGRIYACNINEGVRRKIKLSGKRIPINGMGDYINALPNMLEGLMEKAKNGNVSNNGQLLWWLKPHATTATTMYCYLYDMSTGEIRRTAQTEVEVGEKDQFFRINGAVAIKFNLPNAEIEYKSDSEERLGRIKILEKSIYVADADDILNARVKEYYFTPDGKRCLCNVINEEDDTLSWKIITILTANEDREIIIRNKNALNNPGIAIGDNLWIAGSVDSKNDEKDKLKLFRYNLSSRKMYLEAVETIYNYNLGHCEVILRSEADYQKYIEVRTYDEYGEDYEGFFYDFVEGHTVDSQEVWDQRREDEGDKIIATDFDDPVIRDGYIEVPRKHSEYGEIVSIYDTAIRIPGQNKAVIAYETDYEGHSTVVLYDYDTNKFKKLLYVDEYIIGLDYVDGYVLIDTCPYFDGEGWYVNQTVYMYDVATGVLKKIPADIDQGYGIFFNAETAIRNKTVWWNDFEFYTDESGVRIGAHTFYVYDIEKNKKYELLTLEIRNFDFDIYPVDDVIYVDDGIIVKGNRTNEMVSCIGPLYYCTLNKKVCISEKVSAYFVCEDQGYVMYYEEQADGSFEWKYYYF